MARPDHKSKIKEHLIHVGYITPLIALQRYGCFRLASVIHRLRNEGLDIVSKLDPDGHYSIYSLKA